MVFNIIKPKQVDEIIPVQPFQHPSQSPFLAKPAGADFFPRRNPIKIERIELIIP
jgi:hypothetical protein